MTEAKLVLFNLFTSIKDQYPVLSPSVPICKFKPLDVTSISDKLCLQTSRKNCHNAEKRYQILKKFLSHC